MYTPIALMSSVVALAMANPVPAVHRHPVRQPQNNLNPNLFAPIEGRHQILAASMGSRYRPDLSSSQYIDFSNPHGAAKAAPVRAAVGDPNRSSIGDSATVSGIPDSNIMNELSHIIQQNNARIRGLKAPVLDNGRASAELAVPIVNAQDPNNVEQFEKLPRINERIPVVNREVFKVPDRKQRIPVANDVEGIVYNSPKVHERIPANNQINLEDPKVVDAVINQIDENMKAKGAQKLVEEAKMESADKMAAENKFANKMAAENKMDSANKMAAEDIHHDHHHHHHQHLHRGADMVDKVIAA